MLTQNRAILFLLSAVAASCHRGGASSQGGGDSSHRRGRAVRSPGARGVECDHDGKKCTAVAKDDSLAGDAGQERARSARHVRAWGRRTSLDLGEDSAIVTSTSTSGIDVQQGSVVVRKLGSAGREGRSVSHQGGGSHRRDRSEDWWQLRGARQVARARGGHGGKGQADPPFERGRRRWCFPGETVESGEGRPPSASASFVTVETRPPRSAQPTLVAEPEPRGLGRMTARVPGRTEVVSGVSLMSHNVDVVVRDGIARTEVEEVFQNDTAQVLEGRYVFPLPTDASISQLALWVNDKPVQGEIVEKKRAAAIFKGIVEDTVRPRDPRAPRVGRRRRLLAQDLSAAPQGQPQGAHCLRSGA